MEYNPIPFVKAMYSCMCTGAGTIVYMPICHFSAFYTWC